MNGVRFSIRFSPGMGRPVGRRRRRPPERRAALGQLLMFSLAIGTLTAAMLAGVYRRGKRRAFWIGFASCGWVYLLLALGPWSESLVAPFLITTAILDLIYPKVVPPPAIPSAPPGNGPAPSAMAQPGRWRITVLKTGGFGGPVAPSPPA